MSRDEHTNTDRSLKRKHDEEGAAQLHKRKKSKASRKQDGQLELVKESQIVAASEGEVQSARPRQRRNKKKQRRAQWTLSRSQGGRYADRDPIYLDNVLITAVGDEIRVLDVTNSLVLAALPAATNTAIVSFDALQTSEEKLIRVLYTNGVLVDWDWTTNTTEESRPAVDDVDVYRLTTVGDRIASVFTTWQDNTCTIRLDGIELHSTKHQILDLRILFDATTIVAYSENAILIGRRSAVDKFSWIELPWAQHITCFDAREVEGQKNKDIDLVVGLEDGVLQLYNNATTVFTTAKLPTPQRLHWHRSAVASAKFSPDGSYLVSGGQETVLVLWQLGTGQKSYLPNLTAAIERIVINPIGNRYALKMTDNSVMVLSTSELKPVANFAGLQASLDRPVTAVRHPINKNTLLLAVPSDQFAGTRPFLQTYDLRADKHIARQALTRNNITDLNTDTNQLPIQPPDVQHMAVTEDGQWLATIDVWTPPLRDVAHLSTDEYTTDEHKIPRREIYLKIWQWDAEGSEWQLNSRIDQPHSTGRVFKLVRDNGRTGFITIGEDSVVRTWRPQKKFQRDLVEAQGVQWFCRYSIDLEKAQDRTDLDIVGPPDAASLASSDDGSLIAAAIVSPGSQVVYLIDAVTGDIKSSHDNIAAPQLRELEFLDRYLVAYSRGTVRIWDVVQNRPHYSATIANAESGILAVNKLDNAIAIALPPDDSRPPTLTILRVQPLGVAATLPIEVPVAAMLPHAQSRGFLVILEDATIHTLSSTAAAFSSLQLVAGPEITDALQTTVETGRQVQLLEGAAVKASEIAIEDDRVVVRPEELAKIFDVGKDASALPSVRDMFHAVAGLFARKPLVA